MEENTAVPTRESLVGRTTEELAALPQLQRLQPYRARQLASWIYARGARSFDALTDLPRRLRDELAARYSLERLPVLAVSRSREGDAEKVLLGLPEGRHIEAVLLQSAERDTLCVSTQAGCAHGCAFCATAAMGLQRNLSVHEIVSQVMVLRERLLAAGASGHFNLVFMGMGEPLANYNALVQSIRVLHEDHGLAVGRRRMTVSTVGLVPGIERLAGEAIAVRLALSLNATTDEIRSRLMPINRRYPIAAALRAVEAYGKRTGQRVTLEYVLLRDVNDSMADARRLGDFARAHGCKINLIPYNPHALSDLQPSEPGVVQRFLNTLLPIAPTVTLRESKGADILAACGQLSTAYGGDPPR